MNRQDTLVKDYTKKIKPLLKMATSARGSKNRDTPQHEASRQYTALLVEYLNKSGSLPKLAESLGVSYAGLRRRVTLNNVSISDLNPTRKKASQDEISKAAIRVLKAKMIGLDEYHDQLAIEYQNGISLNKLAEVLGISSASPLYYGVNRSIQKHKLAS